MSFGYQNFKIKDINTYAQFSPSYAELIHNLCSSKIFPSGILITGSIGVGKSTFADILTTYYYHNAPELYKTCVLYIDTPVDNSIQYCRDILQQASRLIQIYNTRIFIMFDEAHMLSFAAQQVFLASLEREANLTVIFITNDINKICEAMLNRCLAIEIEPFKQHKFIQAFAAYIFNCLDTATKASIEHHYNKFHSLNIYSASGRDIINAILYGDFTSYDSLTNIYSLQDIEAYISQKLKRSEKVNIANIINIISDYLLSQNCQCTKTQTCHICDNINKFIRLSSYINNVKSLQLTLKLMKEK